MKATSCWPSCFTPLDPLSRHPHCRKDRQRTAPLSRHLMATLNRARYIRWLRTSGPEDGNAASVQSWQTATASTSTEDGSVTVTMREIHES